MHLRLAHPAVLMLTRRAVSLSCRVALPLLGMCLAQATLAEFLQVFLGRACRKCLYAAAFLPHGSFANLAQ